MSDEKCLIKIHPEGEPQTAGVEGEEAVTSLDTFAGKIQIKWTPDAEVSSLGLMPYFIEFLKPVGCSTPLSRIARYTTPVGTRL